MRKITLVCSSHREKGLCNAQELLRILRAIDPEVILRSSSVGFRHLQHYELGRPGGNQISGTQVTSTGSRRSI